MYLKYTYVLLFQLSFINFYEKHEKYLFLGRHKKNYALSVMIGTTCFLRETTPSNKTVLSSSLTL